MCILVAVMPPESNDADRKGDDPNVDLAESVLQRRLIGAHVLLDRVRVFEVKNNAYQLVFETLQFVRPDSAARRRLDRQSAKLFY